MKRSTLIGLLLAATPCAALAQPAGLGGPDLAGPPYIAVHDYQGCEKDSPEPGKPCTADADCVTGCVGSGNPVACCDGAGSGSCACQEQSIEKVRDVPAAAPEIATITFDGSVQQLFGGTAKYLYRCDLCLDIETGVNPWWYGGSNLQTDGTNGIKVLPEQACAYGVAARDRIDVSTIYVTGTSGEKLQVECGG